VKDKEALHYLIYDKYPRSSLIDHFFSTDTKLEEFAAQSYGELGDFAGERYEFSVKKKDNELKILLWRSGILTIDDRRLPFEVQKEMLVTGEAIHVSYRLKNISHSSVKAVFGSEWNINLLGGGHNEQAYYRVPRITLEDYHLDSRGELSDIEQIILGNRHSGIELELAVMPKAGLWRFPVESVSNSEGGIERIYQESCLVVLLPLDLPPGGVSSLDLAWQVKPIAKPE
jgi:alpha-amylase